MGRLKPESKYDDAPGNRSATMPLNSGTSFLRNLHRLTLMMDLSINTNSSSLGNLCFRLAAGARQQST